MTKYIVNSGSIKHYPDKNKIFLKEFLKDLPDNPKVLFCFFAQKREDWERKYEEKIEGVRQAMPNNNKIQFDLALPDTFERQVVQCDAIIIYGGDDHLLLYWLKQYNIPKIWEGKTVSVSSAASDAMSTHFWTCDWRMAKDGLAILPIKMIPHFKSEYGADDPRGPINWDKAYKELQEYGDKSLPMHALGEGEFIVINK